MKKKPKVFAVGDEVEVFEPACGRWLRAVVTDTHDKTVLVVDDPIWFGAELKRHRIRHRREKA